LHKILVAASWKDCCAGNAYPISVQIFSKKLHQTTSKTKYSSDYFRGAKAPILVMIKMELLDLLNNRVETQNKRDKYLKHAY